LSAADLETPLDFDGDCMDIEELEDSEWLWRTSCAIINLPNSGQLFSPDGLPGLIAERVQPRV
jgi:hypothetical protein